MTLLETATPDAGSRGRLMLCAEVASLLVTACVVWTAVTAPSLYGPTPGLRIARALGFALLAWLWSAAMLAGLYYFASVPSAEHAGRTLRASTAAVWFAPAIILMTERSPAAMLAAVILVVNTTRALYAEWWLIQPAQDPLPLPLPDGPFAQFAVPPPGYFKQLAPGLTLAFFLQAGSAAWAMRYRLVAAACIAVFAAFATAFGMARGAVRAQRPAGLPRSAYGAAMTILLAALLTIGGSPYFWVSGGSGTTAAAGPPGARIPAADAPFAEPARISDHDFPGVILRPEVRTVTLLVDPVPTGFGFSARSPRPLGIPFSGEYWLFRWPYRRPPIGSYSRRGSPAALAFHTTDRAALRMEAHHKFDAGIDPRCCGRIQVAIWNADPYPGAITLELVLVDDEPRGRFSFSLGALPVKSVARGLPVYETLDFPIPATGLLPQFNELQVVFHRARGPADKSVRIEIDRFILVPAGA